MVKLILALLLLAGVVKIAASFTERIDNQNILFSSEENKKGSGCELKEKQEDEQAFHEWHAPLPNCLHELIRRPLDVHPFFPTHHDEPSSPPPNITHS